MRNRKNKKNKRSYKSDPSRGWKLKKSIKELMPEGKDIDLVWHNDGNKLSDVIVDFAKPLLTKALVPNQEEKAISIAILVWNMCIVPDKMMAELRAKLHESIGKGDKQAIDDMNEVVDFLVKRKNLLYGDDKRFILSYNITNIKKGIHLEVAYSTIFAE